MRLARGNPDFRCFVPHTRVQTLCDSGLPPLTLDTRGVFSRAASPRDRPKAGHRRRVIRKVVLKSRRLEPETAQEKPLASIIASANFKRIQKRLYCILLYSGVTWFLSNLFLLFLDSSRGRSPVSPSSPKILRKILASVPAPRLSPVCTNTW